MVQMGKNRKREREPLKVGQIGSSGRKKTELSGLYIKRADLPFAMAGVLMFAFIVAFAAGSFIIRPRVGRAVDGLGLADVASVSLDVSHGSVDMQITPVSDGALVSGSHDLIATTNVPTGYNLSLEAITSASNPAPSLTPTTGTIISPTTLDNNTWGFALASTSAVGVVNDFDASYATPNPSPASKWANPLDFAIIKNTSTAETNDVTTVYYGARADMAAATGVHSSVVTYTATANTSLILTPSILSITPTYGEVAGGTAIVIVGTGFTLNNESITTAVTIDGQDCYDVSISSDTPTTGQDTIYCNTPAGSEGAKDVTVNTWGGTVTDTDGLTYAVEAAVTFISPSVASVFAGSEGGPTFTIVGSNFTGATRVSIGGLDCEDFTVVNDNHIICTGPNDGLSAGSRAVIISKDGVDSDENIVVTYSSTDYLTLQSADAFRSCSTDAQIFRDARDSQLYYVKKMADGKCWMVDNLKYAGFGELSQAGGKYLTSDGTNAASSMNYDVAKWVDPGASAYCTGGTGISGNTNTRCGLLYNWYAATRGTGTYSIGTRGNQASASICPANFRLPSGMSGAGGSMTDGTTVTIADLPVLNASMNAGTLVAGDWDNSFNAGWLPTGAWGGMLAGNWDMNLLNSGNNGMYWTSTAHNASDGYSLNVFSNGVNPGSGTGGKFRGLAVRCVMDSAAPSPPPGTNLLNISSTNPAVIDVYPTTGWEGDIIAITSNASFTNVSDITVGGTVCTRWGLISTSLATCILPAKEAGTANNIVVTNNGTNITPVKTYAHMKVTYFNPNSNTVNIGGTNYDFYANGFTSANCSAMTASNAAIGLTPATSLVYVRDTRNKQTYRVKKMVDNKCWMVDSLKYIDTNIINVADNTIGMTYNNGDHLGDGGANALNTVDESDAQSSANSDKAFFNNPMRTSYCYKTINMPNNTLTRCGYLYNWYAATNGTGTYSQKTLGDNVSGNICPANFRLPSGRSDGSTPTSNGTLFDAADFPVLNASMNAGSLATGTTDEYYTGWRPSGAWGGTLSWVWHVGFGNDHGGGFGNFWSSTVNRSTTAVSLNFYISGVSPGNAAGYKYYGYAVRCVMP